MRELLRGAHDVGRGLRFVRAHPETRRWLVAPAIVTLVLLAGAIAAAVALSRPLVERVAAYVPDFAYDLVSTGISIIVVAGLAVGAFLVFVVVAGVVAGPFNEILSERVEEIVTGKPAPSFALGAFLKNSGLALSHAVRRLAIAIGGLVVVFAIGFVPGIGTAAAAAFAFVIAARAAAYDSYDAVLGRRSLRYAAKAKYLEDRRARTLGLGAVVAGLLLVPIVNLLAFGLGAVGATLAALEPERDAAARTR
jgi:CysZ protein